MDIKDSLKYLLIVLIISFLFYLVYKNYKENKTLEKFMQRNSLSSYFQSDDDSEFLNNKNYMKHDLNHTDNIVSNNESKWNGTWIFKDSDANLFYITFLQVNKDLLIIINKAKYTIIGDVDDIDPYVVSDSKNAPQCLPDMVICKAELNNNENIFFMKHVFCTNNGTGTGDFQTSDFSISSSASINAFYGSIEDDGTIKIYYDNGGGARDENICTRDEKFQYGSSAEYLLRSSYSIPIPNVKNSLRLIPDVCNNSSFKEYAKGELSKCYITDGGLPTPSSQDNTTVGSSVYNYNTYGTGCSLKNKINDQKCSIQTDETCFIPIKNSDGTQQLEEVGNYNVCKTDFEMTIKNQSALSHPLYAKEEDASNLLDMCKHISGFKDNKYNSAILMYVDNLSNVETLNYDFFGIKDGQNFLTTKLDLMFPFMNRNILDKYRENIDEKSLRLTNCIENNNNSLDNFTTLLGSCKSEYADTDDKYKKLQSKINNAAKDSIEGKIKNMDDIMSKLNEGIDAQNVRKLIQPTVWSMHFDKGPEYTNNCSFILGTSNKYNKESKFVKYAEFDSSTNKTKLNLHKGGNKQKLILENSHIIDSFEMNAGDPNASPNNDDNISDDYILLSGNLRTYHPKKYLVPGQGSKLNNFGKELYLQTNVKPSGKWIILGFNLTKDLDSGTSKNLYNNTLINTLKKINKTMNKL